MQWIAFLRGINVGGHRIVRMNDLKTLFENCGCKDVKTYIQSGNVLFSMDRCEEEEIQHILFDAIYKKFGFEVPVVLRSTEHVKALLQQNPFSDESNSFKIYVNFFQYAPALILPEYFKQNEKDKIFIQGREIWLKCEGPYHKTTFSNAFFEKNTRQKSTARNIETIAGMIHLLT